MTYIKEYWDNKEKRARRAVEWTQKMARQHPVAIKKAVENTITYLENQRFHEFDTNPDMEIIITDSDSVRAILNEARKIEEENSGKRLAVLNFSSFKNPGGMFEQGSKAQEECLCHESFLYNVLKEKMDFYEQNRKYTNRALYLNRALYTPDVTFGSLDYGVSCDVITCAAPNRSAAQKHCGVTAEENHEVLKSRIKYVLDIAKEEEVDVLILGAYGCGVFGQNPSDVAKIFKDYLESDCGCFDRVVFAIPNGNNKNLSEFCRVFKKKVV